MNETIVPGFCRECAFRKQEWVTSGEGEQWFIDKFCAVHGTFMPDDGYCSLFEPEHVLE